MRITRIKTDYTGLEFAPPDDSGLRGDSSFRDLGFAMRSWISRSGRSGKAADAV